MKVSGSHSTKSEFGGIDFGSKSITNAFSRVFLWQKLVAKVSDLCTMFCDIEEEKIKQWAANQEKMS